MYKDENLRKLPIPTFERLPGAYTLKSMRKYTIRSFDEYGTVLLPVDVIAQIHATVYQVLSHSSKGHVLQELYAETNIFLRSCQMLSMFFSKCIEKREPPAMEQLDLYIVAMVRLVVKVLGVHSIANIHTNHRKDIFTSTTDYGISSKSLDAVEEEIITKMSMNFPPLITANLPEWISTLVGSAQYLIHPDIINHVEERGWRVAICTIYNMELCLSESPITLAVAILGVAVELVTGSVVVVPFIKRIMQIGKVNYDLLSRVQIKIQNQLQLRGEYYKHESAVK